MIDLDELERLDREATPGPWKIAITKFPSGDSEWEYQLATERGHAATPYSDFALIVAARNALPDLIAELRMLRAEDRSDRMRASYEASVSEQVIHAETAWYDRGYEQGYAQGRLDALRGVQAACLFEMGKLEPLPVEDNGPHWWDWEGFPEEMRMHDAFDRIAKAAEEAAMTPEDRRERGRR